MASSALALTPKTYSRSGYSFIEFPDRIEVSNETRSLGNLIILEPSSKGHRQYTFDLIDGTRCREIFPFPVTAARQLEREVTVYGPNRQLALETIKDRQLQVRAAYGEKLNVPNSVSIEGRMFKLSIGVNEFIEGNPETELYKPLLRATVYDVTGDLPMRRRYCDRLENMGQPEHLGMIISYVGSESEFRPMISELYNYQFELTLMQAIAFHWCFENYREIRCSRTLHQYAYDIVTALWEGIPMNSPQMYERLAGFTPDYDAYFNVFRYHSHYKDPRFQLIASADEYSVLENQSERQFHAFITRTGRCVDAFGGSQTQRWSR